MIQCQFAPVSVIIPCFRCTKTIERAITSVAAQTLVPAEIILIDDASGDGTLELLKKLCNTYKSGWIKIVALPQNVGAGSARNAGWAVARQEFIAFLDADDAWHSQKIKIQYDYMQSHPEVILSGHECRIVKQDALPDWALKEGKVQIIGKWRMIFKNQFVTPSVMVRRDIQQRFIEHQRYMEDQMLWMQLICLNLRIVKLSVALAAIYKNPFGVTGLSSKLWPMQRSDLVNFYRLYQTNCINIIQLTALFVYSVLKYVRRIIITMVWLRWKK